MSTAPHTPMARASTDSRERHVLTRDTSAPLVRMVHLGLGAFSRSHIAWYTQLANERCESSEDKWGISAYAGRTRSLADSLSQQNGLYTLVERGPVRDRTQVVASIVRAHPADDLESLFRDLAAARTSLVSLTITEAGYRLTDEGVPDVSDPLVVEDMRMLEGVSAGGIGGIDLELVKPQTVLARLLVGLEWRRRSGSGAITVLSCDNLPDNGGRLERGIRALASTLSPELSQWIQQHVSFPSSSVDRITPRVGEGELRELSSVLQDEAPVVAEPFSDWVVAGSFPAGRPAWGEVGATFVDDIGPWEARKLWMLNGAHTLLACLGLHRGHTTVAEAIADPRCREAVEQLWDEDAACLPSGLALDEYRAALVSRFENPRIEHRLAQIANDSFMKLQLRVVPVINGNLAEGRRPWAGALAVAAWVAATRRGLLPADSTAQHVAIDGEVGALVRALGVEGEPQDFVADVQAALSFLDGAHNNAHTFGNRLS